MGGCIGTRNSRPSSGIESTDETNLQQTVSIGKNQPLRHEKPRWKSDVPLMEGQLRSKRDEFWDTAPAFEGRKEIWDALKAAAYAAETNDFTLAQAIIDGANISLPNVVQSHTLEGFVYAWNWIILAHIQEVGRPIVV